MRASSADTFSRPSTGSDDEAHVSYDTLCSTSSQIEVTGIFTTSPPNALACFNVIQPGLPLQVFSDGFESGDTSAWSTAVP